MENILAKGNVNPLTILGSAARYALPFHELLRQLKRTIRPYEDNEANTQYCLMNGIAQLRALKQSGIDVEGKTVLEFGSGWLPVIPWLMYLAGADRLILTDIERLMDDRTIARTKSFLGNRTEYIAQALQQPHEFVIYKLNNWPTFTYVTPWDPESQPAESVDIIMSRAVFEHVPHSVLTKYMEQFVRMLRTGGCMVHLIDNSDHWQHRQRELSRINFLRFSDTDLMWRIAQYNPQSYQNRLRHSDYATILNKAGMTIVYENGEPDEKCLADLTHLPIDERFRSKSPRDLAILESLFVAHKSMLPNSGASENRN